MHTLLLIYTICMANNPGVCKEITAQFYVDVMPTPFQCQFQGQVEMAKIIESHLGWNVTRFKCIEAKEDKQDI